MRELHGRGCGTASVASACYVIRRVFHVTVHMNGPAVYPRPIDIEGKMKREDKETIRDGRDGPVEHRHVLG